MKKKYIIWDWNGTLLNDVDYCVKCMNKVLQKHNIKSINNKIYKNTFTFPVKDYYQSIGFDFNKIDFEIPAMEFIEEYYNGVNSITLHDNAEMTLRYFNSIGKTQFCLSAMEHSNLTSQLSSKNLLQYFEKISGIDNHFAKSKVDQGKKMISELGNNRKDDFVLIGDTIHDFEVADNLGIDTILISHGHQNKERLKEVTKNIIENLTQLKEIIE